MSTLFCTVLKITVTILFNIVSSLFKPALEAFHWVHDFLFSKSPCQNCCIEYSKKPRDVEASQGKGGGVGREKSPSLSASLSFTLTLTQGMIFLLFLIFLSHKIKDGGQHITNINK